MALGDILGGIGGGLSSAASAVGGGISSLLGGIGSVAQGGKEILVGKPAAFQQIPRFTPEQLDFIKTQIMPLLVQQLQQQPASFAPIGTEARRQFAQQTVPGLAERFTSLGRGAISSPAFASQLGSAGAGLESQLGALESRFNLAQQGLSNQRLSSLLGIGLAPQFESAYNPATPGLLQYGAQTAGQLAPIYGLQRLGLL